MLLGQCRNRRQILKENTKDEGLSKMIKSVCGKMAAANSDTSLPSTYVTDIPRDGTQYSSKK